MPYAITNEPGYPRPNSLDAPPLDLPHPTHLKYTVQAYNYARTHAWDLWDALCDLTPLEGEFNAFRVLRKAFPSMNESYILAFIHLVTEIENHHPGHYIKRIGLRRYTWVFPEETTT